MIGKQALNLAEFVPEPSWWIPVEMCCRRCGRRRVCHKIEQKEDGFQRVREIVQPIRESRAMAGRREWQCRLFSAMNLKALDGCEQRIRGGIRGYLPETVGKVSAGNFHILCTQRPISLHRVHQVLMSDSVR